MNIEFSENDYKVGDLHPGDTFYSAYTHYMVTDGEGCGIPLGCSMCVCIGTGSLSIFNNDRLVRRTWGKFVRDDDEY